MLYQLKIRGVNLMAYWYKWIIFFIIVIVLVGVIVILMLRLNEQKEIDLELYAKYLKKLAPEEVLSEYFINYEQQGRGQDAPS